MPLQPFVKEQRVDKLNVMRISGCGGLRHGFLINIKFNYLKLWVKKWLY